MASAAIDDEDIAISFSSSRRGSTRGPDLHGLSDQTQRNTTSPPGRHAGAEQDAHQRHAHKTTQQRLGQYQLLKTLGEGSFGKVKLAVHQTTGQKVALKIIPRRRLVARDMVGRIEREIQYLQLLRHPHIIKLFTVITTQAEIVMVLEYAGSELFNYIVDHGKMQEDKARQFFQQIVCAVEYCHRHKIVHRDLKPENLLLDDNLHVKIADFGLSNIMTDGNFLKTSCGSPNYAAPEVISGKLYAGPEVDVWSCGVILYVLLVGRLPFDDEYIPSLFKKIAQGHYHVPSFLSTGAARLIKKMLQVSPVHRITVQEIRQDPWFVKDLPLYLQPPVEEFMDTGVDPNKAIDPSRLAPNQPVAVQEKIHENVVGKLGKTMGYGREDVQQALAVDEPNAIKDAYLIVRENQIMKDTPHLAADPNYQPFLAQSPPIHTSASPIAEITEGRSTHYGSPSYADRARQSSGHAGSISEARSPINTIGVLPSSLPDYHKAFMDGHPQSPSPEPAAQSDGSPQQVQSPEQQAATARRLKPHSRSQMNIERLNRPESMTPVSQPQKKPKQIRWQFGIRSRNQPAEAMLAIYKALKAMNAEWEVPKIRHPQHSNSEDHGTISGSDEDSFSEDENPDSNPRSGEPSGDEGAELTRQAPKRDSTGTSSTASSSTSPSRGRRRGRLRSRFSSSNDWGYRVPTDPWIINARFRKDGLFPPGLRHPHSTHSSRGDLIYAGSDTGLDNRPRSRRSSTLSSAGVAAAASGSNSELPRTVSPTAITTDNASMTGPAPQQQAGSGSTSEGPTSSGGSRPSSRKQSLTHILSSGATSLSAMGGSSLYAGVEADDSAYVYITIQLYSIEREFYLVDFKCAGYERLLRLSRQSKSSDDDDDAGTDGDNKNGVGKATHRPQRSSKGSDESGGNNNSRDDGDDDDAEETEEDFVGAGRAADEKDISSPFPFLDVASRLIIQLAEAE